MDDFLHFNVGNLAEILTVFGALAATVFSVGRKVEKIETSAGGLRDDMSEMKVDLKKLGDIVTQIAVQKERLDMFDRRLDDVVNGRIRMQSRLTARGES